MIGFLLSLLVIAQVVPTQAAGGAVEGVLRTVAGTPAAGFRVSAMRAEGGALFSQTETDEAGRFRLENVPPGNYHLAAGRVDQQTYYPGTLEMSRAKVVPIARGGRLSGMDFVMDTASVPVPFIGTPFGGTWTTPVQLTVEGRSKFPVFSPRGFVVLRLTRESDGTQTNIPLNGSPIGISDPAAQFRVSVENLPDGYIVKSVTYGATDLKTTFPTFSSSAAVSVTLGVLPLTSPDSAAGVRVTGRARGAERRSIYISGKPGTYYSDGTFEFTGVLPGRYAIATLDNPDSTRPAAASVVVGNRDVGNIDLNDTPVLPLGIKTPVQAATPGARTPGAVRLATVRGRVVDELSKEPVIQGTVFIAGHYGSSFSLNEGEFEIPRLLPGNYNLEVQAFAHRTIQRTLVVGDEDIRLDLNVQAIE